MINHMLDDGLPYPVIIDEIGEAGEGLNAQNLTNWKNGGYQDYLKLQETIEKIKAQTETAIDILSETGIDARKIHEACNLVAATQLFSALIEHGDAALKKLLVDEPSKYIVILNVICRIADSGLRIDKHNRALRLHAEAASLLAASREGASSQINANQGEQLFSNGPRLVSESQLPNSTGNSHVSPAAPVTPPDSSSQIKANQGEQTFSDGPRLVPESQHPGSTGNSPVSASAAPNCHDLEPQFETQRQEHCLYCGEPLPPLLPDGQRPSPWRQGCDSPIAADPGFAIREVCPTCRTALPLHGYTAKRHSNTCPECHNRLPDLDPSARIKWLPPQHELQTAGLR